MDATQQLKIVSEYPQDGLAPVFDGTGKLVNRPKLSSHIQALVPVPGLRRIAQPLLKKCLSLDEIGGKGVEGRRFKEMLQNLNENVETLRIALKDAASVEPENSIRIRLPEEYDFHSLIKEQQAILKALEQLIINPTVNGNIRVNGWENGSLWISIALGSASAVGIVAAATWAAAVVRKKWLEGDLIQKQVAALGVRNESLTDLAEKTKEATETVLQAESAAIHRQIFAGEDGAEQIARIKFSITVFHDMISRGAEIHPSLMEPESSKNLFPDFKALDTIASKIPQLQDTPPQMGLDSASR